MSATLPPDLLLPDAHERRQIFYLLKKESSWTAWDWIRGYYKTWVDAVEESVRQADENGWMGKTGVPYSDYVLILKGYAHFEEGVQRLRKGDKRVFQYNAHGEFAMAARIHDHWQQLLWLLESGDNGIDYEHTPNWNAVAKAITELNDAWGECGPNILEREDLDAPAPNIYGVWYQEKLPRTHFPENLPEVPDPTDNALVHTGKTIPCSGIWEPVDAPKPKGFSLFKPPPPSGPFPIIGCMNYLHGGSPAPRGKQETEHESLRADVTWRLLWRDDRYKDGMIPEEERGYRFMLPESDTHDVEAPAQPHSDPLVTAESGKPAPCSGRWLPEHDLEGATSFEAGQLLPEYKDRPIRWVLAQR